MKISSSPEKTRLAIFFVLAISLTIALTGCSVLQSSGPTSGDGTDEESQYGSQEQALDSEDGDSADESSDEDFPLMLAKCPKDSMELILVVAHTWDYSPNRDLELMRVNGQTGTFAHCLVTVHGRKVTMEDCQVAITNTGFAQTDEGPCDISASGFALITADEPYCDAKGNIVITFIESIDADAESSGAMNCPGYSQGWFPYFPHSITTKSFRIQVDGDTKFEDMDPDLTGQFKYHKEWSLHSQDPAFISDDED